jgi:uncharacterized protein YacL
MQKRRQSLVETLVGTAVGFVLSVTIWEFVVKPVWHLNTAFISNLQITLLFTVVSIARGYVLRRVFNQLHNKNNRKQYDEIDRDHGPRP